MATHNSASIAAPILGRDGVEAVAIERVQRRQTRAAIASHIASMSEPRATMLNAGDVLPLIGGDWRRGAVVCIGCCENGT